jgi:hypothetical protein
VPPRGRRLSRMGLGNMGVGGGQDKFSLGLNLL